ncbi:unnamed protein product [Sphagnum jensenii]|uniref:TIR domain-containing protein n=1 Tax=Sphagnum jensenii TaxID=128206 RepID=A0ABP0W1Q3_9BRYO
MFKGMWAWIVCIVAWVCSRFFSRYGSLVPLAADPPDHASASRSPPKADPSDVSVNKESSSSSFDRLDTYDVFLNHRGPHGGKFVVHLYEALCIAGFRPFLHAKSLVKGQRTFNSIDDALWGVRLHMAHLKLGRKEDVKRWEQALLTATNIIGFRLCEANGDEVQLKRKIVMAVQNVLPTLGFLQQAQQHLVRLQGSVMEVANQLDCLFQQAQ